MKIIATVDDKAARAAFARLEKNAQDTRPAMKEITGMLLRSIADNFEKEGRPKKWKAWSDETQARKNEQGATKILEQEGHLASRITDYSDNRSSIVGTNEKYGPTHQFGDKRRNIPARPFLLFQDEDIRDAERILTRHLMRGV